MPSNIPWGRIGAESVAVIASILIAFSIDAAWDSHIEEAELRDLLEGLRSEFVENRSLAAEADSATLDAIARLTFFATGSVGEVASVPPPETYRRVYLPLIRDWRAEFSVGFLDAAIGGGKLSLIRNADTRAALTGFRAKLNGLSALSAQLDRMGADAAAIIGGYPGGRAMWGREGTSLAAETLRQLHQDRDLVGLASSRLIYFGGYETSLAREVRPQIERTIALLDRDLAELR